MKKLIAGLSFTLLSLAAWALPTLQQVEAEVQKGNLTNAESMMREVVAAKPGSAKAHYIYAELLARNGSFALAAEQARLARAADPQITFTQPEKFRAFEQLLERELQPVQQARPARQLDSAAAPTIANSTRSESAIPSWVWGAGLAALAFVAWRGFSRSRAAAAGSPGAYPASPGAVAPGPFASPGAVAPFGVGPATPPGARSSMLGTGLAVAGGVAAGMLADELLHRRHDAGAPNLGGLGPTSLEPIEGGSAASDLQARPVDFGNGVDWGADAGAADAGSFDGGGDGGSDGGWS
ncbi:MAG TPA: hypothetical protein VF319_15880 [Caldimonas sp.]